MLRQIEHKIESLFEGIFGRAFRTHVQPVELARKLAKEMDDGKTVSVSRSTCPNEYSIFLSPDDREQFDSYEESLVDELQQYLAEHARREEYALLSEPRVIFNSDADLTVGEFGIATRMVQQRGGPQVPAREPSATMIYRPSQPPTEAASPEELGVEREVVSLSVDGRKLRDHEAAHGDRPLARLRRPDRGSERVAAPRGGAAGGNGLLDRRPRLDERPGGERASRRSARSSATATRSRSARPRSSFRRDLS